MIGIVVVSHSRPLATAAIALAAEMIGGEPGADSAGPVMLPAAGLDETTLGTDAAAIAEAIERADRGEGVLVLLDLGSAVLSAELATEFVDPDLAGRVRLSPAPLVEGLLAAVVAAAAGQDLDACDAEARRGLAPKLDHLGGAAPALSGASSEVDDSGVDLSEVDPSEADPCEAGPCEAGRPEADRPAARRSKPGASVDPTEDCAEDGPAPLTFTTVLDLPHGLHARPAAAVVAALAGLDVEAVVRNLDRDTGEADGDSAMSLLTLGLRAGDRLSAQLTGPDAAAAHAALSDLAAARFGES